MAAIENRKCLLFIRLAMFRWVRRMLAFFYLGDDDIGDDNDYDHLPMRLLCATMVVLFLLLGEHSLNARSGSCYSTSVGPILAAPVLHTP